MLTHSSLFLNCTHADKTIFTSIFPRLPRLDRNEAGLKTTLQNIQMFVSSILSMDLEQKRHHPTWETAAHRSITTI